jgi:DNA-binding IclR family transcriptional regulator
LGLGIEQIHRKTSIAKTNVYRIIRTLVVSGYLIHKGDGAYSLAIAPYSALRCPVMAYRNE